MRRRLSDGRAAVYRTALPLLWVGMVLASAWLLRGERELLPALVLVAIVPAVLLRLATASLREVSTDGRVLFVSDGRREVEVPFSQVAGVRENPGTGRNRAPTITLLLGTDSPFGRQITFAPKLRFWPGREALARARALQAGGDQAGAAEALWAELSVAEEIRQHVRSARAAQGAGEAADSPFEDGTS